jgi:hypothetical protein
MDLIALSIALGLLISLRLVLLMGEVVELLKDVHEIMSEEGEYHDDILLDIPAGPDDDLNL